jgi:cellulose synthase/poly-beta-1,6-N-acetylglucosamine synthase-like glycosyltransferase
VSSTTLVRPSRRTWSDATLPIPEDLMRRPSAEPSVAARVSDLTVIVPAYNEAESVADTIRSIQAQTLPVAEILVVDDCSTDGTGEVARQCGVRVLRPRTNTGSKAGAQNFALARVETQFTLALDADTVLAPDAIERLLAGLAAPEVAAVCGFVLPRHVSTLWERGRYIEYLFAFGFLKPIQDYYGKPMIASGCFSAYRTDRLREQGGWSTRTLAEDMDLTWSFYEAGWGVRFVPEAVSYPIEPHDYTFMGKQLRRWSHGFAQNVRLHGRGVLGVPFLRWFVFVALWDALVASTAFLLILPLLAIFVDPLFLLGYLIDGPAVLVPVLVAALPRGEVRRALASLPAFWVLRAVNAGHVLAAFWAEFVRRRPLLVYEKGH